MDGTYFWDVKRAMIMTIELPSKNVQHQVETFVEFNNLIGKIDELLRALHIENHLFCYVFISSIDLCSVVIITLNI